MTPFEPPAGPGLVETLTLPLMLLGTLAIQLLFLVAACLVAILVGRWVLDFAVRVGFASAMGRFGAAVALAYRRRTEGERDSNSGPDALP
ncbi:MAG: hypothetical protein AAGA81_22225 [Acidobacteriota bacterium]